jgi:BlaI family transcriptional regulator, penicillinase repressor
MMKRFFLVELELKIFDFIKRQEEATVQDVFEYLGKTRNYNTVMTVMSRMALKKELLREKDGRKFVYKIVPTKEKKLPEFLGKIKRSLFKGKTKAFVSYLLEEDKALSKKELEEIEEMIQKMKKESV